MKLKHSWIGVVLVALVLFGVSIKEKADTVNQYDTQPTEQAVVPITVSLIIDGFTSNTQLNISESTTVLQILKKVDSENSALQLSVKEYSGLGTLVQGMFGIENGTDNKYWQYTVNGVMPQVGADILTLKNGDAVRWYFDVSAF